LGLPGVRLIRIPLHAWAFFFFHAAAVCILTNTLTEQAVQVFGLFRDFGDWMDGEPKEQEQNSQSWEAVFPFDTFSPS
jgi:hypothetical protein